MPSQAEIARKEVLTETKETDRLQSILAQLEPYKEWINHPFTKEFASFCAIRKEKARQKIENRQYKTVEEVNALLDKVEVYKTFEDFCRPVELTQKNIMETLRRLENENNK